MYDTSNDELPVHAESRLRQFGHELWARGDIEERLDLRFFGAGPDDLRGDALPKNQRERIDEDRFARAGFAREDIEARLKSELELLDENKLADAKEDQHRMHLSPEIPRIPSGYLDRTEFRLARVRGETCRWCSALPKRTLPLPGQRWWAD